MTWRACPLCATRYGAVGEASCPFCRGEARVELGTFAVAEFGALVVSRSIDLLVGGMPEFAPPEVIATKAAALASAALTLRKAPVEVEVEVERPTPANRQTIGRAAGALLDSLDLRAHRAPRMPRTPSATQRAQLAARRGERAASAEHDEDGKALLHLVR